MAVSIGSLFIDLRASTEGLSKDAAKAVQYARRLGNQMALAVGAGAVAAGAGLATAIHLANERIDALAKSADRLGVPIEKLRTMQHVAEMSGSSIDGMNQSLAGLQNQVVLAAAGSKKAQWAFEGLGVSASELMKLSPDEQFARIADALNKVENQSLKAAYAQKIFGGTGQEMLSVVAAGAGAVDDARRKLDALGVTLSRVDAAKVEMAGDAMAELKLISEGATNQLAVQFAPILKGVSELLLKASMETKGFSTWITNLVDWGVTGIGFLADAFRGWQLIVKGGQIVFIALYSAADYAFKNIKVGVLTLAAVVTEALRGWKMIGTVLQIAFYSLMDATKSSIQPVLDYVVGGVNELIATVNALAGTKFKPISLDLTKADWDAKIAEANKQLDDLANNQSGAAQALASAQSDLAQFQSEIASGTDEYTTAIKQTWGEMESLLEKPLPSDSLKQWVADIRSETQKAAEDVAAAVKPVFEAVDVPPISEDTVNETKIRLEQVKDSWIKTYNPWTESLESLQSQVGGLVRGTITWNDALKEVAATFVTTVVQSLIQMAAVWVAQQIAMQTGLAAANAAAMAATTGASLASAAAIQAAWIPAAIAASIATMGGAAAIGTTSFISALLMGSAAAVGIGAVASVASGFLNTAGNAYGSAAAGARAQGGHVNQGSLYKVNENGTEFFRPDVSGEVVPMGDMTRELESSSGPGMSISINQTFTGGVTEKDLMRQSQKVKQETLAAMVDGVSRGGSFRKGVKR